MARGVWRVGRAACEVRGGEWGGVWRVGRAACAVCGVTGAATFGDAVSRSEQRVQHRGATVRPARRLLVAQQGAQRAW